MNTDTDLYSRMLKIRELNDDYRRGCEHMLITDGIVFRSRDDLKAIVQRVRDYEDFTPDSDPFGDTISVPSSTVLRPSSGASTATRQIRLT